MTAQEPWYERLSTRRNTTIEWKEKDGTNTPTSCPKNRIIPGAIVIRRRRAHSLDSKCKLRQTDSSNLAENNSDIPAHKERNSPERHKIVPLLSKEYTFRPHINSASRRLVEGRSSDDREQRRAAKFKRVLQEAKVEEIFHPKVNHKSTTLVASSFFERQQKYLERRAKLRSLSDVYHLELEERMNRRSPPVRVPPLQNSPLTTRRSIEIPQQENARSPALRAGYIKQKLNKITASHVSSKEALFSNLHCPIASRSLVEKIMIRTQKTPRPTSVGIISYTECDKHEDQIRPSTAATSIPTKELVQTMHSPEKFTFCETFITMPSKLKPQRPSRSKL